jgi:starvation-inducible outer membrane lipoprotein
MTSILILQCRPQKRWLSLLTCAAIAVHLTGCASIARSQTRNTQADQAVRQACAPDYRSLCSGVRPGGGQIAACFKQHASELSQPCRSALQAAQAAKQQSQQ